MTLTADDQRLSVEPGSRLPGSGKPTRRVGSLVRLGEDLCAGIGAWNVWTTLGWNDIRQRYRRSVLGPLWLTLSTAIFTLLLGVIYSKIFHMAIQTYLPYVALGLIAWGFIAGSTTEGCGAFTESERIIKQISIPLSVFVLRVVWRNFLILMHTLVLIVPIALVFHIEFNFSSLLVLPGLALLFLNELWICLSLAILSTRFRDVPQIVGTGLQVLIFATPIMWPVTALGPESWIADVNPAYHLIELIRAPLLGNEPALLSWAVGAGMAAIGFSFAILLFSWASRRIVYWL